MAQLIQTNQNKCRKYLIGGNWKCNFTLLHATKFVTETIDTLTFDPNTIEVIIAPISLHLIPVEQILKHPNVQVAAQNCSKTTMGAYTGEISPCQLKDVRINWVIIGHSERRQYYNETDQLVSEKTLNALQNGLKVILCIGERLDQREAGHTISVVKAQLDAVHEKIKQPIDWNNIVIAYEPVWAIGTGKVATPEQAQEVHAYIREYLTKNVSLEIACAMRIIYGGSANGKNSAELIAQTDIDGFLVGGASLKPEFIDIVNNCSKKQQCTKL